LESVRLLLAIAGHFFRQVHHMDVKSEFLNGEIKETIYIQQPPSFIDPKHTCKVLHLHKMLYGHRQAPHAWKAKLDQALIDLGFRCCVTEHGMYIRGGVESRLLVGVYVDDSIISGADNDLVSSFKIEMQNVFKMSDLAPLSYYLGIKVHQSNHGITISQGAYAEKILLKAGLEDCNPCHTLMEARLYLSKEGAIPGLDDTSYRSLIGSL
jgi:hypothetical protein